MAGLRFAVARIRALIKSIFGGASPRQKYFSRSERAIAGALTGNRALSEALVIIGATRRGTLIGTKMASSHFRPDISRSERALTSAHTGKRALSEAPVTIARASGSGRRTQLARNARRHFGQLILYLLHHVGLDDVAHALVV
ncbi:MAG: hypothetical protein ACLUGW_09265, partial [Oscillospiraceae bacterium]